MNVFEAVKQSVTTRQAAEHYGIKVNRNGMCVCPFHNDKNPSMKVERMMKETPHPGWDNDDPCRGCRYYKECKGKKRQCRKRFRALIVEPRTSGQRGPKS